MRPREEAALLALRGIADMSGPKKEVKATEIETNGGKGLGLCELR
jgi:hypothetical protein